MKINFIFYSNLTFRILMFEVPVPNLARRELGASLLAVKESVGPKNIITKVCEY